MFVDERHDKWRLACPTTGISFWVDPKNDPDWEVIYWTQMIATKLYGPNQKQRMGFIHSKK